MKKEILKAWAITCPFCEDYGFVVCCHDRELNIYRKYGEARENLLAEDGLPNCTGDKIVEVEVHILPPKRKKNKK